MVDGRYLLATEVDVKTGRYVAMPDGFCNWCGKPLPPNQKSHFCPPIIKDWYNGTKYQDHECYMAYYHYWNKVNRFKRSVFIRDNFTCKACGKRLMTKNEHGIEYPDTLLLHCDHINPYSKGGETKLDNLQTLCRTCNLKKSAKTNWKPPEKATQLTFNQEGKRC